MCTMLLVLPLKAFRYVFAVNVEVQRESNDERQIKHTDTNNPHSQIDSVSSDKQKIFHFTASKIIVLRSRWFCDLK